MGGINVNRWLIGGLAAAVVLFLIEGAGSVLYVDSMTAAMEEHGLAMQPGASVFLLSALISVVAGLVLVFLYALTRTRLGPGPKTAVTVAIAMWAGGYFLGLLGYQMIGLFPTSLVATWGVISFVEFVAAGLVGGWLYREA